MSAMRVTSAVVAGVGIGLLAGVALMHATASDEPKAELTPQPAVTVTLTPSPMSDLPACESEDAAGPCFWDATARGNGEGRPFVAYDGEAYYLPVDWLNAWPTTPLQTYDEGVLMCGANAAPAEDVSPEGNHWAYCEPALVGDE